MLARAGLTTGARVAIIVYIKFDMSKFVFCVFWFGFFWPKMQRYFFFERPNGKANRTKKWIRKHYVL